MHYNLMFAYREVIDQLFFNFDVVVAGNNDLVKRQVRKLLGGIDIFSEQTASLFFLIVIKKTNDGVAIPAELIKADAAGTGSKDQASRLPAHTTPHNHPVLRISVHHQR